MTTTSGIGGLDVQSLVSQLMKVERQPIDKLNTKVADLQGRISSFGTLSGLVSGLQSAARGLKGGLEGFRVLSANADVLSASASSQATAGVYTIEVAQLARAQSLVSPGQASRTLPISTSASTIDFTIGGGSPVSVTIPAGASLEGIRDAINNANPGARAIIINDGNPVAPFRLVFTAESGLDKAITRIESSDPNLAAILNYGIPGAPMTQPVAARNALLTVNGVGIESASNTITDAIPGVTLTLRSTTAADTTVAVERDTAAIRAAAEKFVEAYNALHSQLKSRSAFATGSSAAGVLAGDSTVRQMLDQLRSIFMTPATGGSMSYLTEVGITTQAGGTLKLDGSKLSSALASDFAGVDNLLNGADGFATRLDAWAGAVTQTGGLIQQRTQGMNEGIKGLNAQIAQLERRMTALQKQYTTTYSNLNMMLARMNDVGNYLTSQFK